MTVKLQEGLQEAINLATEATNQQVEPEHLLLALFKQEDSIVAECFSKLNFPALKIIEEELSKIARVSGKNLQVYFSGRFNTLMNNASKEAKAMKDEFVSGEHVLLAIFSDEDSPLAKELKRNRIDKEKVLTALASIRGTHRITDEAPEEGYPEEYP